MLISAALLTVPLASPHADPAGPGKPLVQFGVGLRMHKHWHAKGGCRGERRPRFLRTQQKICPRTFNEYATQAKFLDCPRKLARALIA